MFDGFARTGSRTGIVLRHGTEAIGDLRWGTVGMRDFLVWFCLAIAVAWNPNPRQGFGSEPAVPEVHRLPRIASTPTQVDPPPAPLAGDVNGELVAPANQVPTLCFPPASRPLSLYEAVLWSMANTTFLRISDGTTVTIAGVTSLDPAIVGQQIQESVARFDPTISGVYAPSRINQPPSAFFGPGIGTNTRRDEVDFQARVAKIWGTGGTTSIGYEPPLAYLFFPSGSTSFNPMHSSDLVLEVRQPLLRGAGRTANLAPVRIAECRTEQASLELQVGLQGQLRSTVQAYWELHAAYVEMQAVEQAMPLAERNVQIQELRYGEERVTYADVARAAVKLEDLRQQRIAVENLLRQRDLRLRQLLGFPLDDSPPLKPIDVPVCAPPAIRMDELVYCALVRRPDLRSRRLEIAVLDQSSLIARNSRLPQVDVRAAYRSAGLADDLGASLTQMTTFGHTDWTLGLEYTSPVGNRKGKASWQAAQMAVTRERALLSGNENQVAYTLASLVAGLQAEHGRFESAMRQVEHSRRWQQLARLRFEDPPLANRSQDSLLLALVDYQTAIQAHLDALGAAAEAVAAYNAGLARIEEARGTILDRWEICGPLGQPIAYGAAPVPYLEAAALPSPAPTMPLTR